MTFFLLSALTAARTHMKQNTYWDCTKGPKRMMYTNHHYNLHHPYHWYIGTALMMNSLLYFLVQVPSLSLDSEGYWESRTESSACVLVYTIFM